MPAELVVTKKVYLCSKHFWANKKPCPVCTGEAPSA
jgi:hypothetical protein